MCFLISYASSLFQQGKILPENKLFVASWTSMGTLIYSIQNFKVHNPALPNYKVDFKQNFCCELQIAFVQV